MDLSRLPTLEQVEIEIDRRSAKKSLAEFAKAAWTTLEPASELKWGWALDAICEHLEAVTHGEIRRLLANVPPGSMKALLTGVIWPAWEWGPQSMPSMRFLGTAHKQDLAVRDNIKCRRLIQSDWYQKRWPLELAGDQNAKTKFENAALGFREAMAFESMTGSRGDRVILDDPHSVDDANSKAKLASGVRTFREALPSRVNNEHSAIVIIMQRLHENDVSAEAIELGYEHLLIPMRYEPSQRKTTSIGWSDPRSVEGELMFPERFSESQVRELEHSLGTYATAGQLQQRPAPDGGGIFRNEWWKYYTLLPSPDVREMWIYADTAQKTGQDNDWSVFQLWAATKSGQVYLLDQIRGKWEAPELLVQARAFWLKHKAQHKRLRGMKVEDKSSGIGLIQTLKREGVPVLPIPRSRDKRERAYDVTPMIESGQVYLPERAEFLADLLAELSSFPNGSHDDQVDPLMDAISDLSLGDQGFNWGAV